jgi:hypothetical protein
MDETMLEFGEKCRRAVVFKNEKLNFGYVAVQKPLMHITLCATIFGDNTSMRPFMIIPSKNFPKDLLEGDILQWTAVGGQESGWITGLLFRD